MPIPVMFAYGTRPEAIKLAPVIRAFQACGDFAVTVAVTGQHRAMLDQINAGFGIAPDHDLDLFAPGQTISTLAARTIEGLEPLLADGPRAVFVQGDTTSAFAAALAAFYAGVDVIHVEAGLRTPTIKSPFPEEGNRRLVSQIAALHLAATAANRANLLREGHDAASVVVTGNPVIDALQQAAELRREPDDPAVAAALASNRRIVLVTSHRRESWGEPMRHTARALARLAQAHPGDLFVFPLHANPLVRDIFVPALEGLDNFVLTEPLGYFELAHVMSKAYLALTDSGGIQEEAPSLGVPVVVLRDNTERMEGVDAGTAVLVGTDEAKIFAVSDRLLSDASAHAAMARAVNPYGDGRAAGRIVEAVSYLYGLAAKPADFAA